MKAHLKTELFETLDRHCRFLAGAYRDRLLFLVKKSTEFLELKPGFSIQRLVTKERRDQEVLPCRLNK